MLAQMAPELAIVGEEAKTLDAGKDLFDRGFYVQSVLFPAVPYRGGVLRVQCNANHTDAEVEGLLAAFVSMAKAFGLAA